jgi:sugar-specific transcriptional regulator TrmB
MASDENALQILTQLGLTALEAKIYIALNKYENLTIRALSTLTKTSRPDTYRITAKLQKKGLIEKIIQNPAHFKAVPMDTGIAFLLKRMKADFNDLTTKTTLLLQTIQEKPKRKFLETETPHFTLIPQRETVVRKINEAIEKAKESVDIFLSWKRFSLGITSMFSESSQKAWERGVKFRIVVENPKEAADGKMALKFCGKTPLCHIRFLPKSPKTVFGLYDKKQVFIVVKPRKGLFDSPALWSNNQSLISAMEDYFEILWLTAIKEPKLETQHSRQAFPQTVRKTEDSTD